MKLSSNFIRFHDEFGLEKTIDIFSKAGYEAIDFNADLKEYHTDAVLNPVLSTLEALDKFYLLPPPLISFHLCHHLHRAGPTINKS